MRSNSPPRRLSELNPQAKLKLVGDPLNRTFVLAGERGDGYYDLHCNGRLSVTATGSSIVSPLDEEEAS